jgi:hypothetical protein
LITEQEVVAQVLAPHGFAASEKYVQEVLWRTYWKGWLEMRPALWQRFIEERYKRPLLPLPFLSLQSCKRCSRVRAAKTSPFSSLPMASRTQWQASAIGSVDSATLLDYPAVQPMVCAKLARAAWPKRAAQSGK